MLYIKIINKQKFNCFMVTDIYNIIGKEHADVLNNCALTMQSITPPLVDKVRIYSHYVAQNAIQFCRLIKIKVSTIQILICV